VEFRRLSLTYVVAYLGIGGTGFLVAPEVTRQLLLSNQDYEDVGFRLTGMMMLALAYLVWNLVRNQDWKYYPVSIHVRTGIVIVLTWLYFVEADPMFLVLDGIVLIGLVPSMYVHYLRDRRG
jgi:hypothetical protein